MVRGTYAALALVIAGALPVTSAIAADKKLLSAASDHFELYTTDNEALVKPALEHFETVRAYLLEATGSPDPFQRQVRIVGFKSWDEFNGYVPWSQNGGRAFYGRAFSIAGGVHVTIAMAGLEKEMYQYGALEYVARLLDRTSPKLPYWFKMGLAELYSTLRVENGRLLVGSSGVQVERYVYTGEPDLSEPMNSTRARQGTNSDYGAVMGQLTHMLRFHKDYSGKFDAFIAALSDGEKPLNAMQRIYGQSLNGLERDLNMYLKVTSRTFSSLSFELDKPVTPQISSLSPSVSAAVLAELRAAKSE